MSDGYNLTLRANRETAHRIIDSAPMGSRFSVKPPRRTIPQNDKFWAVMGELAAACPQGRKLTPEQWKCVLMDALGIKATWVPALDGEGVVNTGYRSSRLSVQQMSDLIELAHSYGAQHGVQFSE
jgi:hypothetical protein